jgi:hypothetical protein
MANAIGRREFLRTSALFGSSATVVALLPAAAAGAAMLEVPAVDQLTVRVLVDAAGGEDNFCQRFSRTATPGQYADFGALDRREIARHRITTVLAEKPVIIAGHAWSALVGLSGSAAAVRKAADGYRVYYRKVARRQGGGGYDVDHSAAIYLMDRDRKYVDFFPPGTPADRLAEILRRVLAAK